MAPIGYATLWQYPIEGKGGHGCTIVQPISESFLALDVWTDHDGAYLFICSCLEFEPAQLRETISMFGLNSGDTTEPMMLRLK